MLEILSQVRCWKERVDQITLLVGDARSTASGGHWSESLHKGRGGVYLPGENLAAFKWVKMKTTHPRNIIKPERESVLVCLKLL